MEHLYSEKNIKAETEFDPHMVWAKCRLVFVYITTYSIEIYSPSSVNSIASILVDTAMGLLANN